MDPSKQKERIKSSSILWGPMPIEMFKARLDPYRVTYPGYPVCVPFTDSVVQHDSIFGQVFFELLPTRNGLNSFKSETDPLTAALAGLNMSYTSVRALYRQRENTVLGKSILLLETDQEDNERWPGIALFVWHLLQDHGFRHAQVEICNPHYSIKEAYNPYPYNNALSQTFLQRNSEFCELLGPHMNGYWPLITLHMNQAFEPVLLLWVAEGQSGDWGMALTTLQEHMRPWYNNISADIFCLAVDKQGLQGPANLVATETVAVQEGEAMDLSFEDNTILN